MGNSKQQKKHTLTTVVLEGNGTQFIMIHAYIVLYVYVLEGARAALHAINNQMQPAECSIETALASKDNCCCAATQLSLAAHLAVNALQKMLFFAAFCPALLLLTPAHLRCQIEPYILHRHPNQRAWM